MHALTEISSVKKGGLLMKRKSFIALSLIMLLLLSFTVACTKQEPAAAQAVNEKPLAGTSIILSTTTSTENSGLLDFLLPKFKEETGVVVKVVAVGSGQAIKLGEDGDADVILAHAKASEDAFVAAGHGLERFEVMYNDFVVLGPKENPLKLTENAKADVVKAFQIIQENEGVFISRGDDSGTHKAELIHWKSAGIEPSGKWYVSAGKGMGDVIQMADEMLGYTLSDRASYLSMMNKIDLTVVVEGDKKLFNQYGIIAVNPDKSEKINHVGAQAFIDWMLSEKGQGLIAEFGKDKYGQSLFIPNAIK